MFLVAVLLVACTQTQPQAPAPALPADTDVAAAPVEPAATPAPVAPTEPRYAATEILVAWKGAVDAPETVTRTEDEAKSLADALARRAKSGEDLGELAKQFSDSPSGPRGGKLGTWLTGTMVPEFESEVAGLDVGGIGVVRTPFGWHVVRRDAIVQARVSHILVSWSGAPRSAVARTKDEAKARAQQALDRVDKGEPFAQVAKEMSDDPSASQGGDLGPIAPGQMVPAFEDAAFALKPGQHSGLVETVYGWHVLMRTE